MSRRSSFVDCVEVSPGVWATPAEADQVRAQGPALEDANKRTRPRTVDDIPSSGTPIEFFALIAILTIALSYWRG